MFSSIKPVHPASTLVNTYVELIDEGKESATIVQHLADSQAYKKHSDLMPKHHVGVFYNPSLCGESSSKPHLRVPPLRKNGDHLKKLTAVVLQVNQWELKDQQLWFLFDSGKSGYVCWGGS